jgi:thioesterase domain-containing protein
MPTDPSAAERYLHDHIPVSAEMGVRVRSIDDGGVRLWAPLSANVNHQRTVFGGSAAAVAILAGWTLVWSRLREAGFAEGIVIQRGSIEYLRPLHADFEAQCPAPPAEEWERFTTTLARRGRARLVLHVDLWCEGERGGAFHGTYVATPGTP